MIRKLIRYAAIAIILIWGGLSVFVLCGDETPGQEMSQMMFIGSKLIAIASLYGCYKFYRLLDRIGILSEFDDDEIQ